MDKWINASSYTALRQEIAAHRKALPVNKSQLGDYFKQDEEFLARLKLHLDVMRKAKTRRPL